MRYALYFNPISLDSKIPSALQLDDLTIGSKESQSCLLPYWKIFRVEATSSLQIDVLPVWHESEKESSM